MNNQIYKRYYRIVSYLGVSSCHWQWTPNLQWKGFQWRSHADRIYIVWATLPGLNYVVFVMLEASQPLHKRSLSPLRTLGLLSLLWILQNRNFLIFCVTFFISKMFRLISHVSASCPACCNFFDLHILFMNTITV